MPYVPSNHQTLLSLPAYFLLESPLLPLNMSTPSSLAPESLCSIPDTIYWFYVYLFDKIQNSLDLYLSTLCHRDKTLVRNHTQGTMGSFGHPSRVLDTWFHSIWADGDAEHPKGAHGGQSCSLLASRM